MNHLIDIKNVLVDSFGYVLGTVVVVFTVIALYKTYLKERFSNNGDVKELQKQIHELMAKIRELEMKVATHEIGRKEADEKIRNLENNFIEFLKDMFKILPK